MVQARDAWASRVVATAEGRSRACREVTPNGGYGGLAAYDAAGIRETSHIPQGKVVIGASPRVYDKPYGPPLLNSKDEPDGLMLPAR